MADPDSTSWLATALGGIGLGGGSGLLKLFTTQSAHATKLKRLEEERDDHADKIDKTHTAVTKIEGQVDRVEGDVTKILGLLENYPRRD